MAENSVPAGMSVGDETDDEDDVEQIMDETNISDDDLEDDIGF